jgi:hypothetical protein
MNRHPTVVFVRQTIHLFVGFVLHAASLIGLGAGWPLALRAQPTPPLGCRVPVVWFGRDGRTDAGIAIFGHWVAQKGGYNIPATVIPDYYNGTATTTPSYLDPDPSGARIISLNFHEDCTYRYDVKTPRGPWTSHSGRYAVRAQGIEGDFRYRLVLYPSADTILSTPANSPKSMPRGFESFDGTPQVFGLERSDTYRTNAQLFTVAEPGPGFYLVDSRLGVDDQKYEKVLFEPGRPAWQNTNPALGAASGRSGSGPERNIELSSLDTSARRATGKESKVQSGSSPSWRISIDKGSYSIQSADGNIHIVPNFQGPLAIEAKLRTRTSKKGKTEIMGEWRTNTERGFMQILDVTEKQIKGYMLISMPGAYSGACRTRTAAFLSNFGEAMNQKQAVCRRLEITWVYE